MIEKKWGKYILAYNTEVNDRIADAERDQAYKSPRFSEQIRALVCGIPTKLYAIRRVMMLRAFVDDSGSGGDSRFYVLAGYLASIPVWESFTDEWAEILSAPPRIEYFKMREAESRKGQFLGFSENARDEKLKSLITVIEHHPLWEASCAIPQEAYDSMLKPMLPEGYDNAYFFAFAGIITAFSSYEKHHGTSQKVDFVFDKQQEVEKKARRIYEKIKDLPPFQDRVENIDYRDDEKFLPLQAADLIAWQNRRFLSVVGDGQRSELLRLHKDRLRWYRKTLGRKDLLAMLNAINANLARKAQL